MNKLDEISQAIGALEAGAQERRVQMERVEGKLESGLAAIDARFQSLSKELREGVHARANAIQGDLLKIELRVKSLEDSKSQVIGAARANARWSAFIGAIAGGAATVVVENWHSIFGGGK